MVGEWEHGVCPLPPQADRITPLPMHDLRHSIRPMNITLENRVSLSPDVMLQEVGGEGVLLDLKSESYFGLDGVGTRIWRLVEDDGHLQVVHARLLDEYDVEPARLEDDLREWIGRLAEAGLVNVEFAGAEEA